MKVGFNEVVDHFADLAADLFCLFFGFHLGLAHVLDGEQQVVLLPELRKQLFQRLVEVPREIVSECHFAGLDVVALPEQVLNIVLLNQNLVLLLPLLVLFFFRLIRPKHEFGVAPAADDVLLACNCGSVKLSKMNEEGGRRMKRAVEDE